MPHRGKFEAAIMATCSVMTTHVFRIHELKTASVTVFMDRAEVKRTLKALLKPGMNEVLIENLTCNVDDNSVVVDGRGDAIIHEVQLKDLLTLPDESLPRMQELKKEKERLEEKQKTLQDRKKIATKCIELLDSMVGKVGETIAHSKDGECGHPVVIDETLDNVSKLISYYEDGHSNSMKKMSQLDDDLRHIHEEIKKVDEQMNKAQSHSTRGKSICILLESRGGGDVEVDVSYQVAPASWCPVYEIRVHGAANTLKLSYFGKIKQRTGEDWVDAPLTLSTARPSLGCLMPRLGTLNAEFKKPKVPHFGLAKQHPPTIFGSAPMSFRGNSEEAIMEAGRFDASPRMAHAPVDVFETSMSTMFSIAHPATIPSGSNEHKVTIAVVDLTPTLFYESVPSKNADVYLLASILNESKIPFFAGQASVYFDNSLTAKTHLKTVLPEERFRCSMGVDRAIKIEYKPAQKYTEQGYMGLSVSTASEQKIIVKNTKSTDILITIRHHIPKSTDEKIKIKLLSPELGIKDSDERSSSSNDWEPVIGARLDANNNLEWTVKLSAYQEKQLSVKWSVEHPSGQEVTFREVFSQGNLD